MVRCYLLCSAVLFIVTYDVMLILVVNLFFGYQGRYRPIKHWLNSMHAYLFTLVNL